jgi:hypothetical protein
MVAKEERLAVLKRVRESRDAEGNVACPCGKKFPYPPSVEDTAAHCTHWPELFDSLAGNEDEEGTHRRTYRGYFDEQDKNCGGSDGK